MHGRETIKADTSAALASQIRQLNASPPLKANTRLRQVLLGDIGLKFAALGIAIVFWSISFFLVGNSIRTVTVPVEFSNVPAEMEISSVSTNTVQLQVRGSDWLLDSASLNSLVARFDLTGTKQGNQTLPVEQSALNLPPGLVIENVSPRNISLKLTRSGQP
jgi:hypothetical protein